MCDVKGRLYDSIVCLQSTDWHKFKSEATSLALGIYNINPPTNYLRVVSFSFPLLFWGPDSETLGSYDVSHVIKTYQALSIV